MTHDPPYNLDHVRSVLRIGEIPAERLVALDSHNWMAAGMLAHSYEDPEVEAHVRRLEALLKSGDGELDLLRKEWLSAEEYERVNAEIAKMHNPDYEW